MPEVAELYFFVKMCTVGDWLKYGEMIFQTIYELTLCSHENKNMSWTSNLHTAGYTKYVISSPLVTRFISEK